MKDTLVQLTIVDAVECKEAVTEIHLAGCGVPDAGRDHRLWILRIGYPGQHHQICIEDLLRFATLEIQPFSQEFLCCETITTKRVRRGFVHEHK